MNWAHTYQLANIKYPLSMFVKESTECKLIVNIGFAIFNDPAQIRKSFCWFLHISTQPIRAKGLSGAHYKPMTFLNYWFFLSCTLRVTNIIGKHLFDRLSFFFLLPRVNTFSVDKTRRRLFVLLMNGDWLLSNVWYFFRYDEFRVFLFIARRELKFKPRSLT